MGSVIVLGGLNIDHFIGIPRIPADGDVLTGRSLSVIPGGKGLNQAIAAARLGANVKLIGCVGHDEAGNMLVTQLIHEGVDTSQVRRSSEHMSGVCYLFVLDNSNEPIGIRVSGANEALSSLEVTASVNSLLAQSATGLSKPVFLGQFGVGKTAIGAGLQAARSLRLHIDNQAVFTTHL